MERAHQATFFVPTLRRFGQFHFFHKNPKFRILTEIIFNNAEKNITQTYPLQDIIVFFARNIAANLENLS